MKQLATSNLEFQQSVSSSNMQFQQNVIATIQDLKTQIGQLANTSAGSSNPPSQTIPNLRGNASVVTLRSGKELPQPTLQQLPRSATADSEPNVDSQSRPEKSVPTPFQTQTVSARKPESDEDLLKMFRKVKINIPLLNAIKQVSKFAKFLKELCVHKRKNMKGNKEIGGVVSALTRKEEFTTGAPQALLKKCRDPGIFSVPCTIGESTFAEAMLDLGASINVMPASIYRVLNFGDLEPMGMTIQLANRSIVQPLGILEDVLVQVNELIFPTDFYVLDMEDETSRKESTLILGRPFLMTTRTKIDVHAGTLSMEFGDTLVQFNIFKAMKHPTEDHSLFGIDMTQELVEEYFQPDSYSEDIEDFAKNADVTNCLGSITEEADYEEVHNLPNSEDDNDDIADLDLEAELFDVIDQVYNHENLECVNNTEVEVAETSKPSSAQLATIFTAKGESATEGRDQRMTKVNSAKQGRDREEKKVNSTNVGREQGKTKVNSTEMRRDEAAMIVETISTNEGQKQGVLFTISSGSDSEAAQEADADCNLTSAEPTKRSRPKQPKVEILTWCFKVIISPMVQASYSAMLFVQSNPNLAEKGKH
ncbi:hypothetical protein CR513_12238, partial [Mucuna pruriens]